MFFHKLIGNKWMWCSGIESNRCRFRVDMERTKHDLWSFLCLFNRHVVYLSMHKVLLSPATLRSRVPSANLRGWLPRPLSTTLLWTLHPTLGTVVGIMPQLYPLEATTRLNWCSVSHWCTWGIVRVILLLNWSTGSLLVKALGLLSWTLERLVVVDGEIPST
jgi:hypothetical protein